MFPHPQVQYERAFYGSQYATMAPPFEHQSIG